MGVCCNSPLLGRKGVKENEISCCFIASLAIVMKQSAVYTGVAEVQ